MTDLFVSSLVDVANDELIIFEPFADDNVILNGDDNLMKDGVFILPMSALFNEMNVLLAEIVSFGFRMSI